MNQEFATTNEQLSNAVDMQDSSLLKNNSVLTDLNQVNFSQNNQIITELDFNEKIKKIADQSGFATLACRAKTNNPNYLSIIHSNKIFQKIFHIEQSDLLNKSYDFLFEDIDLTYSSADQVEYTQLILAVKEFREFDGVISLYDFSNPKQKIKFKISFIPHFVQDTVERYALFIFEKIDFNANHLPQQNISKKSPLLLKNLERSLRNERLLREISGLIISDLALDKIASTIAKTLCNHFKCERCIIHDYQDDKINFVVEFTNKFAKKIVSEINTNENDDLINFIAFQKDFYFRCNNQSKKVSIFIADDIEADQNFEALQSFFSKYFVVNQIAITMAIDNKIIGQIFLHQSDKRTWLQEEIEALEIIANQLLNAIVRFSSMQQAINSNFELMQKSQQLEKALAQEQEMRRMQNEFIALVSHEFKTPLQIIDSTRENLQRKIKNSNFFDDAIDKSLERIKQGVSRMNGLINSTLNLAKLENNEGKLTINLQKINLTKIILDNIEKINNLAKAKNIEIKSLIANDIPEIVSDQSLLDHIINNLISNAIKYSNLNSVVEINLYKIDNFIELKIIDFGIGIPQNDLKNIGQKFFRASNSIAVAGTGIGLYLTKNFIELLSGSFSLKSQERVGTEVSIKLPIIT